MEKIRNENLSKYDEIKKVFEDNLIKITGLSKKNEKIPGIPHNIKYFKCGYTPREPEDYLLSNVLLLHIKEMIELENAIQLDDKNVVILNKDDFNKYILNESNYNKIERLWVNQNIIFDAFELNKLKAKSFKYIPREYFGQELREAAE